MIAAVSTPTSTSSIMSTVGEWPSLSAAHGKPTPVTEPAAAASNEDEWEMLSPNGSGVLEGTKNEGAVEVVAMPPPAMPPRLSLVRKSSQSAPDLRELEASELLKEEEEYTGDSQTDVSGGVIVSNPPSVADTSTDSAVMVISNTSGKGKGSNPWSCTNKVSFKDAILTPSQVSPPSTENAAVPRVRRKIKTRYVVAPIKRCTKSTGDLLSLAVNGEEDDDEGDHHDNVLGDTDAQEYYSRKSHGAHGRTNGAKIRPDEAKRKQMIVHKKNLQRAKQKK